MSTKNDYGTPIHLARGQVQNQAHAQAVNDTAIMVWSQMGLTENQILYGIAMMNVESGDVPDVTNGDPNSSIRGLGQFNNSTWNSTADQFDATYHLQPDSVDFINDQARGKNADYQQGFTSTVGTNAESGSSNDPPAGVYDPNGLVKQLEVVGQGILDEWQSTKLPKAQAAAQTLLAKGIAGASLFVSDGSAKSNLLTTVAMAYLDHHQGDNWDSTAVSAKGTSGLMTTMQSLNVKGNQNLLAAVQGVVAGVQNELTHLQSLPSTTGTASDLLIGDPWKLSGAAQSLSDAVQPPVAITHDIPSLFPLLDNFLSQTIGGLSSFTASNNAKVLPPAAVGTTPEGPAPIVSYTYSPSGQSPFDILSGSAVYDFGTRIGSGVEILGDGETTNYTFSNDASRFSIEAIRSNPAGEITSTIDGTRTTRDGNAYLEYVTTDGQQVVESDYVRINIAQNSGVQATYDNHGRLTQIITSSSTTQFDVFNLTPGQPNYAQEAAQLAQEFNVPLIDPHGGAPVGPLPPLMSTTDDQGTTTVSAADGSVAGKEIADPGFQEETVLSDGSTLRWSLDAQGNLTSRDSVDAQGNTVRQLYDSSGAYQGQSVSTTSADGSSVMTQTFDTRGVNIGYSVATTYPSGSSITINGVKTAYDNGFTVKTDYPDSTGGQAKDFTLTATVDNADGSSTTTELNYKPIFNSDGSATDVLLGSTVTQTGGGESISTDYDASGHVTGSRTVLTNSDGSCVVDRYDASGVLEGSSTLTIDSQNEVVLQSFDASGTITDSKVLSQSGVLTETQYHGGSVTGIDTSVGTSDGGNLTTHADAGSNVSGDSWVAGDGSYGSDQIHSDGSSSGTAHYLDSSSSTSTNNGQGGSSTSNYSAAGVLIGTTTIASSAGTVSSDFQPAAAGSTDITSTSNADGSFSGQVTLGGSTVGIDLDVDDGFGRTVRTGNAGTVAQLFDQDGKFTGTSVESQAADGSITRTEYDSSGTETGYSQTTSDAGGQTTTTHYSLVNGVATEDSYSQTTGSTTKQYALNPDGSGTFFETGVTVISTDLQGHVTKSEFDGYGNLTGYVREGIDTAGNVVFQKFDAAGNEVQSTTLLSTGVAENSLFLTADGQVTTTLQTDGTYSQTTDDGEGDVATAQFDASGTLLSGTWTQSDGSSGNAVINADGSEDSFSDDGEGNLTTTVTSASGEVTSVTDFYNQGPSGVASDTHAASWGLLGSTRVVTSSDGLTTTTSDFDSAGTLTDSQSVVVSAGGYDVTTSNFNGSGTLLNSQLQVTSADGLVVTTTDYNSAGIETGITAVTSSADGKSTTTVQYGAGAAPIGSTSVLTSPDGMTTTTSDFDATGALLDYNTEVSSAGGTTITTAFYNASGSLLSRDVAVSSADGSTVTTSSFDSSSSLIGSSVAVYGSADGSVTTTDFNAAGVKTGSQIDLSSDGGNNTVTTRYDAGGTISGQQIVLGGAVEPGNIAVSAVMWHGAPALVLTTPTDSVTVPGGVDPAQALLSTVTLDHSPVANLFQLLQLAASHGNMQSDTVTGGFGNWILNGTDGATIAAGTGADTISAWGSGDTITAGTGGNLIYAIGSGDVVHGGSGNDTLVALGQGTILQGGTGNTLFRINDRSQFVQVAAGSGVDSIESSVSFDLPNHVDVITFTGRANIESWGNSDSTNLMTANDGNDTLHAGSGNDTLVSGSGVDVLFGGSGADTFVINNSADVISLPNSNGSRDLVLSSVSYNLTAAVANLVLTGSGNLAAKDVYGFATITGNAGNDTLTGGSGSDVIIAGTGIDTIIAGSGSNTLVINNVADVIQATSASHNCTVQSSVSYTLGQFLDRLTLTGTANLVGQGNNDAANVIIANQGNDTLIAGSGADTLLGGAGADLLVAGSGGDLLEGGAGDTYQLNAGFGNTSITTSGSGSATIKFGSGIAATDLTLGITIDNTGHAALTIHDGTGTVTVGGAFSGSISQFEFADGTQVDLAELLSVATVQSATVAGAAGNAILNASNSATLAGGFGNDTIVGAGANDTITAGTGNQLLAAYGANSEVIGGVGDDTISAGAADARLVSGTGHTVMSDSGLDATYTLTQHGTTTIDATGTSGVQTVVLPAGMTIADFTAYKDFSGDLIMQSLDGATTAIIRGVYNSTAAWLVSDSLNGPTSLEAWAGASHHSGSSYAESIEQMRSEYAASLAPVLNDVGLRGGSIATPSDPNTFVSDYQFNGASVQNVSVVGGNLTLPSSGNDSLKVVTSTTGFRTETYSVPVYSTENLPGGTVFIPIGDGFSNVNVTGEIPVLGPDGTVIGFNVTRVAQTVTVQTGTRTVTQTIPVQSAYWTETQSMVAYNITGDGGNDTITAAANFVGTVKTGDGNVSVDLGGHRAFTFGNESLFYPDQPPLGAFVEAGAGNDTIVGSGGADTIAAGTGFDQLTGWVGSSFYVPMEGDSADIIYANETFYGSGPFPHNTLVLPEGLTPSDLQYRVFEDPNEVYGNTSQILQITHGDSSVAIYFAAGPEFLGGLGNKAPDDTDGINRFQFSDGTVLTRAQVLAMAGPVQSADSRQPTVTVDIPSVTAGSAVSAAGWFTGSDTGDGHVSWYAITNDSSSGGYFTLDGKTQTAGQQFLVSENQLPGLTYIAGSAGASDDIEVCAYDGVFWGNEVDAQVTFTSDNSPRAAVAPSSHAIQWHNSLPAAEPISMAFSTHHAEGLPETGADLALFASRPTERFESPVTARF